MNDTNKIIRSLEDAGALIHGVTKTLKHEIKRQEGRLLGALLASLDASLAQLVVS